MKKCGLCILLCVIALSSCSYSSMTALMEPTLPASPHNDEEMVIAEALRRAVVDEKDIQGYQMLRDKATVVLESEFQTNRGPQSLTSGALPHTDKVRFVLLSHRQLDRLAQLRGELSWLSVERVDLAGDTATIQLGVNSNRKMSEGSTWLEVGWGMGQSEGYILSYRKEDGAWHFVKVLGLWNT